MDKIPNHECIICGVKYHHCDDCAKMKSFTPWRAICDTSEHYQILLIIKDYQAKGITKDEAKEQLGIVGITIADISEFKDSTKSVLSDILSEDTADEVVSTKKSKIKE